MKKSFLLLPILTVLLTGCVSQSEYDALKQENESLKGKVTELQSQQQKAAEEQSNLQSQLQKQTEENTNFKGQLQKENEKLKKQVSDLQKSNQELKSKLQAKNAPPKPKAQATANTNSTIDLDTLYRNYYKQYKGRTVTVSGTVFSITDLFEPEISISNRNNRVLGAPSRIVNIVARASDYEIIEGDTIIVTGVPTMNDITGQLEIRHPSSIKRL